MRMGVRVRLHPYGSSGPDLLVAHLRSHELETRPPAWRVDAERNGWRRVQLLAGHVHCASADCHRLGPPAGKRDSASRAPATAVRCTTACTTGRSMTRKTTPANRSSRTLSAFSIPTGRFGTTGAPRSTAGTYSGSSAMKRSHRRATKLTTRRDGGTAVGVPPTSRVQETKGPAR